MGRYLPGSGGTLSARSHSMAMGNREPLPMGVVEAQATTSVSSAAEGCSVAERRRAQSARARPGSGPGGGLEASAGGGASRALLPMRRALSNLLGPQFGAAVRSRTVVGDL
jgi:hypothetical protein